MGRERCFLDQNSGDQAPHRAAQASAVNLNVILQETGTTGAAIQRHGPQT